jgi:hypothetical protein
MRISIAISLITLMSVATAHASDEKVLTATEMKALVANGITIGIVNAPGDPQYKGSITISADGTQAGTVAMGGKPPTALSGTWKLKGNQFCRTLKPISDKETCEIWVRTADKEVAVMVGKKRLGLNILP